MASTTAAVAEPPPRERQKPVYSIPVFERQLEIKSLQAQRVMDRAFKRTVRAIYSIDAILRIIGDDAEMDKVEEVIDELFSNVGEALRGESARLTKLMENNGISETPDYTAPKTYTVQVSSPQVGVFASLVKELDGLMVMMDTCWLLSVLDNKQRKEGTFQWQQRMLRLGRRIVSIEGRARKAAYRQGKESEVSEALPPEPGDADQLDDIEEAPESKKNGPKRTKSKPTDASEESALAAEA